MPIRTFTCIKGHTTERILFGERDKTLQQIACDACNRPAARDEAIPLTARRNPAHGIQK